ncbi:MAG: hypothetical protein R3253_01330 [Longimicrobiales bacterium]|nr:hypothetical protein [Longimicrobiales bacterium]
MQDRRSTSAGGPSLLQTDVGGWVVRIFVVGSLLAVGYAANLLLSVGPFYRMMSMENRLRHLATVQDSLYASQGRYESDVEALDTIWVPSAGEDVELATSPSGEGWSVRLSTRYPALYSEIELGCALYVGDVSTRPRTPTGVEPSGSGIIACDPSRPTARFLQRRRTGDD